MVICDEAHRSQYGFEARLTGGEGRSAAANDATVLLAAESGPTSKPLTTGGGAVRYGYAQHLRDALPGATFVAFTGTPVSLDDRDTRAVFGDYA